MATLQKFKLLATQCAVAGSPSRSPTTSPVIHIRRRKTLRMLLGRAGGGNSSRRLPPRDDRTSPDRTENEESSPEKMFVRNKLKDLFVSSPPALGERVPENVRERLLPPRQEGWGGGGGGLRRGVARPLSATLRQRLLRRAWRPVLLAIPE